MLHVIFQNYFQKQNYVIYVCFRHVFDTEFTAISQDASSKTYKTRSMNLNWRQCLNLNGFLPRHQTIRSLVPSVHMHGHIPRTNNSIMSLQETFEQKQTFARFHTAYVYCSVFIMSPTRQPIYCAIPYSTIILDAEVEKNNFLATMFVQFMA